MDTDRPDIRVHRRGRGGGGDGGVEYRQLGNDYDCNEPGQNQTTCPWIRVTKERRGARNVVVSLQSSAQA